eukprot:CAMPEP_0176316906 /NCGR_PEP_ID=MMETSP0121_2-20121125/68971_1 /TAXON_ID=160619 /ORGANISM="Kryptoperidinium foliaceum, Strain CCMP 1326" /LENGTH=32 /DNA_ID= /DNA_START= /DNA_END= /DNA_ORIENTATION=
MPLMGPGVQVMASVLLVFVFNPTRSNSPASRS